jgi:hypothetical protein
MLFKGSEIAAGVADQTLIEARSAMGINYR